MSLLRTLLNSGILPGDAQVLEQHYANEAPADFLDGLEQIARCLATNDVQIALPPAGQPWRDVYTGMQNGAGGTDLQTRFTHALTCLPNPVQIAAAGAVSVRVRELLQWQQAHGSGQGKRRKTAQYIQLLQQLGYKFRYNLASHEIEVNGVKITDPLRMEIRGKARDAGVWEINVLEDAYYAEAWRLRYHPVRDYLTGLKFEGGDPISELANFFTDEHGVFALWLRRWLIGAVARVMQGAQNRMLVLDGLQNLGKSKFAQWLCGPLPEYYHEGAIMPDNRDCSLRRLSTFIWEVSEFGNTTRRADREALKAFLTAQVIRERKPYGHYDTQGQAMASFIGTVNNESGILNDPTGSRRFMIAHLLSIDWRGYLKAIDIDQVWGQAFDLYLAGEPWELTPDEYALAAEINTGYQQVDVVEETIRELFEIDLSQQTWRMSTLEILRILKNPLKGDLKTGVEVNERRLASALTALGLERAKVMRFGSKTGRGYSGIRERTP